MKKKTTIPSDNTRHVRKHPLRQQLAGGFLGICLILASMPIEYFNFPVLAAQEQEQSQTTPGWEVLSFSELPEETRIQTAATGTPVHRLGLPDTLTALCLPLEDETFNETQAEPDSGESTDTTTETPEESTASEASGTAAEVDISEIPSDAATEPPVEDSSVVPVQAEPETVTIEAITWTSSPEYNSRENGTYVFTPVLPENYVLSEDAALPEISITLENATVRKSHSQETETFEEKREENTTTEYGKLEHDGIASDETEYNSLIRDKLEMPESEELQIEQAPLAAVAATPACGTITADTTWSGGTLSNGTLVVEPGVTLTLNGTLAIQGTVTINGGGTIVRGAAGAYFAVGSNADLTLRDITLDGNSITSTYSMLDVNYGRVTLDDGCHIQNCIQNTPQKQDIAAALFIKYGTAVLNDAVIENCSTTCMAYMGGGAIWALNSTMTINGGIYKNNNRICNGKGSGGFLVNTGSKLYIYGGSFIGNTSDGPGGCIYHSGAQDTETYLYGGYFEGNTCTKPGYEGSGAIIYNSYGAGDMQKNVFCISGSVQFRGDGTTSGMDGIYLDMDVDTPSRKVQISNTLSHPLTVYVNASEGYVIAEGINDYILLHERDMKKISFVDVSGSGKTWYAVLDEGKNQVYLSSTNPGYGYYVYYISNGAQGTVTDDNRYALGDTATVQGAEGKLTREGYTFAGWNTEADGSGTTYREGDSLEITGDINLYARFSKDSETTFAADFYSGEAVQKETRTVTVSGSASSGTITAPELKEMDGWTAIGWDENTFGYTGNISTGSEITLTEDTSYYGVYKKDVTLSYDANGGDSAPAAETLPCYANVHPNISYQAPFFTLAAPAARTGYTFQEWNTKADGTGISFPADSRQTFHNDTTLYAVWTANTDARYRVEYYKQDVDKDGYTLAESETLTAATGTTVTAKLKSYSGFTENISHPSRKAFGTVKADGTLVLKLYYDRDVYEINFHLNGGSGTTPDTQKVRYGSQLQSVPAPVRSGYNFKGWYMDKGGTDGSQWDFGKTVEDNTTSRCLTLYAKWADETAPVLGKTSFGTDYTNLLNWVICKKKLIITIPITEEGSGVREAEYILMSEDGTNTIGTAEVTASYFLPLADISLPRKNTSSAARAAQVHTENGQTVAKIVLAEDFKGKITLTCADNAGNISAEKILTAENGGIILEDNAPAISFEATDGGLTDGTTTVKVTVTDDDDNNITAGIASVSYQIDEEKSINAPDEDFRQDIVKSYPFTVDISGAGKHTLQVAATDNAGNESTGTITVTINKQKEPSPRKPVDNVPAGDGPAGTMPTDSEPLNTEPFGSQPLGSKPGTGDSSHLEIYATFSMIAGFTYLLLYFTTKEPGMTEQKKDELVLRLIRWGKEGELLQRMLALTAIFLLLAYYHSIGKRAAVDWREACVTVRKNSNS